MGAGADVNAIFAIASMIIAVPTGVKIFNWLFTMYGGRIVYSTPLLWSIGFMVHVRDRRNDRRSPGGTPTGKAPHKITAVTTSQVSLPSQMGATAARA
jgi:Cytochrome C and Quinol oxidase polypeptide I